MKRSHQIILAFSILLMVGYAWSLDMPEALEVPLRQQPYHFTNFEFNFLYFATYITIFFSEIPVGMILDKYPIKCTVLCLAIISLLSQIGVLLTFLFQFPGYKIVLYFCRGVFGITGEGLFTIQALLISFYGGKYYDRLLGVGLCFPFLFDSINNILTPYMFDRTQSMELIWGVGILFCVIGLGLALAISKLVSEEQKCKQQDEKNEEEKQQEEEPLSLKGLKEMPYQFWVITGGVFFTQYVFASSVDNLNDAIVKRFNISYVNAGYMMFIPMGGASIISYILGLIVQKKPKLRRILMFSSTAVFSLGVLVVYYLPNVNDSQETPYFYYYILCFQFFTVGYLLSVLYGILCSSIVYIVNPKHLGIAWGVIGSAIGFGEATSPLVVAWILESQALLPDGYKKLTLFLFFASLCALSFSIWILVGKFEKIDVNFSQGNEVQNNIACVGGQIKKLEDQENCSSDDPEWESDETEMDQRNQLILKLEKLCPYFSLQ